MRILFLVAFVMLVSCTNTTKKTESGKAKEANGFQMYQMSEMAQLMEEMSKEHAVVKQKILAGDTIGSIPEAYYDIHYATLTDADDNDDFFKQWANVYIGAEENLYKKQTIEAYNNAVNVCLQCHQQKCGGPIPRIKKLFIKTNE